MNVRPMLLWNSCITFLFLLSDGGVSWPAGRVQRGGGGEEILQEEEAGSHQECSRSQFWSHDCVQCVHG